MTGRKPRKPRPLRDPLGHARNYATKLTQQELLELKAPIEISMEAMRTASYNSNHLNLLYSVFLISQEIEHSGIVRGLAVPIQHALDACAAIRTRAGDNPGSNPPALYAGELNAIQDMARFHIFQIEQLSAGELHRLTLRVKSRQQSQGGSVTHIPLENFTGVKFTEAAA